VSPVRLSNAAGAPARQAGAATTMNFLNIMLSIQNCNSLNVSSLNRNTYTKTTAISNLGADIVFLSDMRLNNKHKKIVDIFRTDYRLFYNSSKAKRGVGILVKNSINITIINTFQDAEENILLLHCTLNNNEIVLGAIYGPNDNNMDFFRDLNRGLSSFPRIPIMLGGDWNATMSALPTNYNLDIVNMHEIPSRV